MARLWLGRRLCERLGVRVPVVQAPMAGVGGSALAAAACDAGALGSLPCAMLSPQEAVRQVASVRAAARDGDAAAVALNFFCHTPREAPAATLARWMRSLSPFAGPLRVGEAEMQRATGAARRAFDDEWCCVVEETRPRAVSFHFGLPPADLLGRVKAAGCAVIACATTVEEAVAAEAAGCDVVVAQGWEAGGHRGTWHDDGALQSVQPTTMALVPQVVDAVTVPVVAAGAIADGRAAAAAMCLGAAGVQLGTALLFSHEAWATLSATHKLALRGATDTASLVTNLYSGRPARGAASALTRDWRWPPPSASTPPCANAPGRGVGTAADAGAGGVAAADAGAGGVTAADAGAGGVAADDTGSVDIADGAAGGGAEPVGGTAWIGMGSAAVVPPFPLAPRELAPLKAAWEESAPHTPGRAGGNPFVPAWHGQAAAVSRTAAARATAHPHGSTPARKSDAHRPRSAQGQDGAANPAAPSAVDIVNQCVGEAEALVPHSMLAPSQQAGDAPQR